MRHSTRLRSLGGLCAAAAALIPYFAPTVAHAQAATPSVTSLIPKGTVMFAGVDAPWLWDTMSGVRAVPAVQQGLAQMASQSGISYDNDIAPWVGMAVIGISSFPSSPAAASSGAGISGFALLQIKNQVSFDAFLLKIKGIGSHAHTGMSMTDKQYAGTVYEEIGGGRGGMAVDVAPVNGWLIVGFGAGSAPIEKMLNTYNHNSPSIDSVEAWRTAFANLPSDRLGVFGYDLGAMMSSGMMPASAMGPSLDKSKILIASTFSDTGNGLRSDYVAVPETTAAQFNFQQMATHLSPVTGLFLQQAPQSSSATMFTNPGYYVHNMIEGFTSVPGAMGPEQMRQTQPYLDIVYQFTGEAGFGLTYRPDLGLGLAFGAQAATPAGAVRAATVIASHLKQSGLPLTASGSTYSLDLSAMTVKGFPLTPVIRVRGNWLLISTSPAWLAPGTAALALPAGSDKSYMTAVGNFKWLPGVNDIINNTPLGGQPEGHLAENLLTGLHLENATFTETAEVDPQGAFSHGSSMITGWDYKAAVTNMADAINDYVQTMGKKTPHVNGQAQATRHDQLLATR